MIASSDANYVCPIPKCEEALVDGPNGEAHWCPSHLKSFSIEQIEGPSQWRAMSWEDRSKEVAENGRDVLRKFGITESDLNDTIDFDTRKSASIVFSGNVAPDKIALLNLARGLNDTGALKEIVDNALDCSQRKRGGERIEVRIELNAAKGFVRVSDDAGGMTQEEMLRCMRLGSHTPEGHLDNVIGRFGVGAKEAMYHFGREVTIRSSDLNDPKGLELFVASEWLDHQNWNVDVRTADVRAGTSSIRIDVLEHVDFDRARIADELWNTYAKRINSGRLNIFIDDEPLKEVAAPPAYLYPPELYPRKYSFFVDNVAVSVEVALLDDAPTESGIFFYAFGRRYAHWSWSNPLANTIVPKVPQHHLNTHVRLDIDFQGRIEDIPINSNKDEVVTNTPVFKPLAKTVAKIVQPYLGIISWLSKDNNMSYLQKKYAGVANAHPSVSSESWGFDREIELGRVYETMQLAKPRVADAYSLQHAIASDRATAIASDASTTTASQKVVPGLASSEEGRPTALVAPTRPSSAATQTGAQLESENAAISKKPTLITVSLLTDDPRQIQTLKDEIEIAAKSIGVRVVVS